MTRVIFLLKVFSVLLISSVAQAQKNISSSRNGWLFYYSDKAIWFEANSNTKIKNDEFFKIGEFKNGLIVNYLPASLYYKSIAKKHVVKVLYYDSVSKRADYTLKDSVWILPVKVEYIPLKRAVSELLQPMGLSFKKDNDEVTITYNFETSYDITNIEPLRKCDRRKLKRIR